VISVTHRPLYLRYQLNRRLDGPQNRFGNFKDYKMRLLLSQIKPRPEAYPGRSLVNTALRGNANAFLHLLLHLTVNFTRWRSSLRQCATRGKVAGSSPDGVIGIFHRNNPPRRTLALGLTQPLTDMSKVIPLQDRCGPEGR